LAIVFPSQLAKAIAKSPRQLAGNLGGFHINSYLEAGAITLENDHIKLTDKGMLIADKIINDLMLE